MSKLQGSLRPRILAAPSDIERIRREAQVKALEYVADCAEDEGYQSIDVGVLREHAARLRAGEPLESK